jgi:L-aspartate oxidase
MLRDGSDHVWLSVRHLQRDQIKKRFPNIYQRCLKEGYDLTRECIPVTPAQHYFMGGIKVNINAKTSMDHLYSVGETSCNGVHGANRLASNSLLESLVFAKRAAKHITDNFEILKEEAIEVNLTNYRDVIKLKEEYRELVLNEIGRINNYEQSYNNEIKCG